MTFLFKFKVYGWLSALFLICSSGKAVSQSFESLVPMPQSAIFEKSIALHGKIQIHAPTNADDNFAARSLIEEFQALDVLQDHTSNVRIELVRMDTAHGRQLLTQRKIEFTQRMHDEGYVLVCNGNIVYDIAATSAGIFYGVQTIKQLVHGRGDKALLSTGVIRDWPAMKYRGQDDDLSRGPLPTLEYIKSQIRRFAAYKLNIYSPYFENTLRFDSNPLTAPPGGALTSEEIQELIRYASQYHIIVIPQQEAFGHLHHVLLYEKYASLAETPHGSVLAPGQKGSADLVSEWYAEIGKMFPGPFVHIGADETDDLGWGQTKRDVDQRGLGTVYIDFVKQLHERLQPQHKRILFWGDVAMRSPELVKTLPKDMIAIPWQYSMPEDGANKFDRWITPFTEAGVETWVAPSANRGNRIYPDNDNNLATIQAFVADGQRLGATGMFNTVWNDGGEGLFEQNWYGVLFGAAASWQSGKSDTEQFQRSFGQAFHGDMTGRIDEAQRELIEVHRTLAKVGLSAKNSLFWEDPWSEAGQEDTAKILPIAHELRLHAETAIELIEKVKQQKYIQNVEALDAMEAGARKMDFIGQKFQQAEEIVNEYDTMATLQQDPTKRGTIDDISYLITGNNGQCQDMRDGYGLIRDLFKDAWLKENRPYWLDNVTAQYQLSMELWIQRGINIRAAADRFQKTGHLPERESLGLPPRAKP
jgi:hypothetical protein